MTLHRHDFHVGPEPSWRQLRKPSPAKRIERGLVLLAGVLLAYVVFVFIAMEKW